MFDYSHFYYRFPEDLNKRLDVLYNDTEYDSVYDQLTESPYSFKPLTEAVDVLKESRNPQEQPDEEFKYIDIGSIDTVTGIANADTLLGADATSSRMRRVIKQDNILISTTRPTRNAICTVPEELDNQICSTGLAVLNCKASINVKFLFYALRSEISRLQFERLCSGSGYPAINQETDLPQILIPMPDTDQQGIIVDQVQPLYDQSLLLMRAAEEISSAANEILLQELGIDITGINTTNYFFKSGSEGNSQYFSMFLDEIDDRLHYLHHSPRLRILDDFKSQYTTELLGNICDCPIVRGEQPDYDLDGEYMVIKTADLKNKYIDYENTLRISEDCFQKHPSAHIQKGDILIASTGIVSMGKVDVYEREEPAFADSHISILRINASYDPYFIAYFLRSHLGQIQIEKLFTGASGQIELQPKDIDEILIPINNDQGVILTEQTRIAEKISERLLQSFDKMRQSKAKMEEASTKFVELIFPQTENREG